MKVAKFFSTPLHKTPTLTSNSRFELQKVALLILIYSVAGLSVPLIKLLE